MKPSVPHAVTAVMSFSLALSLESPKWVTSPEIEIVYVFAEA